MSYSCVTHLPCFLAPVILCLTFFGCNKSAPTILVSEGLACHERPWSSLIEILPEVFLRPLRTRNWSGATRENQLRYCQRGLRKIHGVHSQRIELRRIRRNRSDHAVWRVTRKPCHKRTATGEAHKDQPRRGEFLVARGLGELFERCK